MKEYYKQLQTITTEAVRERRKGADISLSQADRNICAPRARRDRRKDIS